MSPTFKYIGIPILLFAVWFLTGCYSDKFMVYIETMQDSGKVKSVDINFKRESLRVEMK